MFGKTLIKELARTSTIYGVVGSGISVPIVEFTRLSEFYSANIRIPGIRKEDIKVELNNRNIHIYYYLHIQAGDEELNFPVDVYRGPVPYDVDVAKITAKYTDAHLNILLPFNDLAAGYYRDVRIASS